MSWSTLGWHSFIALTAMVMTVAASRPAAGAEYPDDPIFDFKQIFEEPLDARVLESVVGGEVPEDKDIVVEKIEYTSMVRDGQPDRIFGILAYPKGGKNLPAIYWSQGGMAPAGEYFPRIFARKGYACFNITLNHKLRSVFGRFDAADPKNANLTRLAVDQMRGITYLASRPEVDQDRIGMGGASYGGFFASLIAGADPRIKVGMSFFAAGHHEMGTNLPQFTQMQSAEDIEVWRKTIDPAWRLARKNIPFMWGIASNDNWFQLPAVIRTYEESIGDKRALIWPQWQHGFPAHIDKALIDWFDIYLKKDRRPYNQAGQLTVKNEGGKLIASWPWSGDNPVKKAELIVAYGRAVPWHAWVYRHHEIFAAAVNGNIATAEIPLPEKDLEAYVYGNITDDGSVVVSTVPVTVKPTALNITKATAPALVVNGAFYGDFEPVGMSYLAGCLGVTLPADTAVKHGGAQSLRLETRDAKRPASLKLAHIPEHSHTLKLWLKSEQPATVHVTVAAAPPANWKSKTVDLLRRQSEAAAGVESLEVPAKMPEAAVDVEVGTEWKQYTLPVPFDGTPLEGYNLIVKPITPEPAPTVWIDDVTFEPVWKS